MSYEAEVGVRKGGHAQSNMKRRKEGGCKKRHDRGKGWGHGTMGKLGDG